MGAVTVHVCDVCGQPAKGQYEVVYPEGKIKADLCEAHAAPLVEVKKTLPRSHFTPVGQRARTRRTVQVVTDPSIIGT